MAATYLPDLKKLLKDFHDAASKIRNEIASIPFEDRPLQAYDIEWELESMKVALITRVGREMVREELGVESRVDRPEFSVAKQKLIDFCVVHGADITREEMEAAISESWAAPQEAMGAVESKTLHIVAEATAMPSEGENKFPFLIIQEGLSANRKLYTAEALRRGAGLFNNTPIYLDHPNGVHEGRPQPRRFEDKVGFWSDAKFVSANKNHPAGIIATANIFTESAHPWLAGRIREAIESGKPETVGVSIYVDIEAQPVRDEEHGVIYKVLELTNARSADLVAEPAAGGRVLVTAESLMEVGQNTMVEETTFESLTEDQLREVISKNPKIAELLPKPEVEKPPVTAPAVESQLPESVTKLMSALEAGADRVTQMEARLAEREKAARVAESRNRLADALRKAKAPSGVISLMTAESEDELSDSDIEAKVKAYEDIAAENRDEIRRQLPPSMRAQFVASGDKMISPVDQAMNALDIFFGNEVAEDVKQSTPKITSIRQFYGQMTGDWDVSGRYNLADAALGPYIGMSAAEAIPTQAKFIGGGTITMGNLFGTSMNRRLLGVYRGQERWWEPISVQGPLSNFKQQDRIRTDHYGPLTNRPVGTEEYTELEWGETVETYTPSGWGNIVSVNRRAIINDDLNGIRRQPVLLARAANITINEYVAALLTTNSGMGVTMSDTNTAFHATRNNTYTLPLTYDNLLTVRRGGMGISDDAGNKLLNQYRYLLVPVELSDTAWIITNSMGVPGSANNDPNIFRDASRGFRGVITVPNFDDANDWYVSFDPEESLMVPIEVGFINDQREPELFVQDGETEGMVFTHDGVYYKVRFEFGADIIDAIAMANSINA